MAHTPPPATAPLDADAVRAALSAADGAVPGGLGRIVVTDRSASTSTELMAAANADAGAWPDRSLLVTDHQTAGRGRAGRTWETPAGEALTFSVLLRPRVPPDRIGWLSLLAGLAVVRAVADLGVEAGLKWPNDVLAVDVADDLPGWGTHRKLAGVLGELGVGQLGVGQLGVGQLGVGQLGVGELGVGELGVGQLGVGQLGVGELGAGAAVLGIGINVHQRRLPVPSATSLAACGVDVPRAQLLGSVVAELVVLDQRWRSADGDAVAAGLAAECAAVCLTLGTRVRVSRPGGELLTGYASGLTDDGALRVVDDAGHEHVVLAGDVEHVRA